MTAVFEALARVIDALAPAAQIVVGFLIAFIMFELQEWRRREVQKRAIRVSLRAELESVEVILNSMVTKFAVGVGDLDRAVKEFRWYLTESLKRRRPPVEIPEEDAQRMRGHSDEDLKVFLQRTGWHQENVGVAIPLPTVEAVLGSPVAGLNRAEVDRLTWLKWQAHLLDKQARDTAETLHLTFSITDPVNHALAVGNQEQAKLWYRKRAEFMLSAVREALNVIRA